MESIISTILDVIFMDMIVLLCLFSCIVASKADEIMVKSNEGC